MSTRVSGHLVQEDLVEFLGENSAIPVTYAGGARSIEDLMRVAELGKGKVSESHAEGRCGCCSTWWSEQGWLNQHIHMQWFEWWRDAGAAVCVRRWH
jgi:hypothetical protein